MGINLPNNISKLLIKGPKYTISAMFLLNLPIELKPSLAPLVPRCLSFCNPVKKCHEINLFYECYDFCYQIACTFEAVKEKFG